MFTNTKASVEGKFDIKLWVSIAYLLFMSLSKGNLKRTAEVLEKNKKKIGKAIWLVIFCIVVFLVFFAAYFIIRVFIRLMKTTTTHTEEKQANI